MRDQTDARAPFARIQVNVGGLSATIVSVIAKSRLDDDPGKRLPDYNPRLDDVRSRKLI